jgi:hypothetical protein
LSGSNSNDARSLRCKFLFSRNLQCGLVFTDYVWVAVGMELHITHRF